jgi:hypothetical protein
MFRIFLLTCAVAICIFNATAVSEIDEYVMQEHPINEEYIAEMKLCSSNTSYCDDNFARLVELSIRLANEHTSLLLYDRVQTIFRQVLLTLSPTTRISRKIAHIMAILSFGQGNFEEVWHPSDIAVLLPCYFIDPLICW